MSQIESFCEVSQRAARAGGAVLLDWAGRFQVREKAPADLVTEADLASQEAIQAVLLGAFPRHGFLAEENASIPSRDGGYRWVVDPLDGTTNYVHGIANYAVSIALEQDGQMVAATVYDPVGDECFVAGRGRGATLNGKPIQVSRTTELKQAIVAASFPPRVTRDHRSVRQFLDVLERARSTRRTGSSALNLSYLAAGRLDAYWCSHTHSWDVAAGWLLVQEAGGRLTNFTGGPVCLDHPEFVAAATAELHAELIALLADGSAAAG